MYTNDAVYYEDDPTDFAKELSNIKNTQIYILKNECEIHKDIREIKVDQQIMKQDIKELKTNQEVMKQDIKELKADQEVMKQDIKELKTNQEVMKQDIKELKADVKRIDKKLDDSVKEIGEMFFEFTKKLDEKLDKKTEI